MSILRLLPNNWRALGIARYVTLITRSLSVRLPPRIKINEEDIKESFLKGSGPGGQKINKTSSAVQLTHLPSGLVVKCQATRSRAQNRELARRLLADRVEEQEKGDQSRTALKAQIKSKKKASKTKKARRKYRKLNAMQDEEENTADDMETKGADGALLGQQDDHGATKS